MNSFPKNTEWLNHIRERSSKREVINVEHHPLAQSNILPTLSGDIPDTEHVGEFS